MFTFVPAGSYPNKDIEKTGKDIEKGFQDAFKNIGNFFGQATPVNQNRFVTVNCDKKKKYTVSFFHLQKKKIQLKIMWI